MKKGFTLVELLAVVVILALILAIAIPIIGNLIENSRISSFDVQEKLLKKSAMTYLANNPNLYPTTIGASTYIKLSDLMTNNYISSISDPKDKTACDTNNSLIKITKNENNSYNYEPFLQCTNYNTDKTAPIFKTSKNGTILTVIATDDNVLSFDGINGYVVENATIPTNITIEMWAFTFNTDYRMLWSFVNVGGPNLMFAGGGGPIYLNTGDSYSNVFSGSLYPSPNEWHHYAVTFNQTSNVATLFIDGTIIGTAAYRNPSGNQLYVGCWSNKSYKWQGYVKDVRVWSTIRTNSDIVTNMNSTLIGNETGLITYLKLNEMEGTIINDSSVNKNSGTAYGTVWLKNSGIKQIRIKQGATLIASSTLKTDTFTLATGTYTIEVEDNVGRISTSNVSI